MNTNLKVRQMLMTVMYTYCFSHKFVSKYEMSQSCHKSIAAFYKILLLGIALIRVNKHRGPQIGHSLILIIICGQILTDLIYFVLY